MTVTREARYLSGNDIGKIVTARDCTDGRTVTGTLDEVAHYGTGATLIIAGHTPCIYIRHNDLITIEGIDTPPGLNLHRPVTDQGE